MMEYVRSPGLPRGFVHSGVDSLLIRPLGPFSGPTARAAIAGGTAAPLLGGAFAFAYAEVFLEHSGTVTIAVAAISDLRSWAASCSGAVEVAAAGALARLAGARPRFAGLDLDRPRIFGVVNLSPDSFFDASAVPDTAAALARAERMIADGADVIDVGGASTRPGATSVPEELERARILPVIEALARSGHRVSVDTSRASVMAAALAAGASIVNDVAALTADGRALETVRRAGASVVLMHMQGEPATMQDAPRYGHAPHEIARFLAGRLAACRSAGVPEDRLAVDPGIGFGKNDDHIRAIFQSIPLFHGLGVPVMFGSSRKSFIGRLAGGAPAADRLPGTLAAAGLAAGQGVQLHRVHDVVETRQLLDVVTGLREREFPSASDG